MKIQNIYDNGGETFDRYTVVYDDIADAQGLLSCLGMSDHPSDPQGFGQHSACQDGEHLGRKIGFFDLPEDCQKAVLQDITI